MNVLVAEPPNIDAIDAVFGTRGQAVLYAHGDTIYNPQGAPIPDFLQAHELIHMLQQAQTEGGPDAWWTQYLADQEFRYNQELYAHRAEFQVQARRVKDRNAREKLLMRTAARLVAPLYKYSGKKLLEARRALVG